MAEIETVNKEMWNNFRKIWSVGLIPHRPSGEEIALYEDYLQKAINISKSTSFQVLVMGATPEIRDMLARYRVGVTLIDVNPNMIRAMDELLEVSSGNEKLVIGDWQNMPLRDSRYDLILCDHGLNNILFKNWTKVFNEMKRVLKSNGFLVQSVYTVEQDEAIDIEQVAPIMKKQIMSMEDKFYYVHRSLANLKDIKGKKYYKDLSELKRRLTLMLKSGQISRNDYELLLYPEMMYEFKLTIPFKNDVDDYFLRFYRLKSVRNAWSHPMLTFMKLYYCQNKK